MASTVASPGRTETECPATHHQARPPSQGSRSGEAAVDGLAPRSSNIPPDIPLFGVGLALLAYGLLAAQDAAIKSLLEALPI